MNRFIQRRLLPTLLGLSVTTTGAAAFADVPLHHNVIHGKARFTNTNTDVLALLGQLGMTSGNVQAGSTLPGGFLSTTTTGSGNPLMLPYELSAESDAGGPAGVVYTLDAAPNVYASPGYPASGAYYFRPKYGVLLLPDDIDPDGTIADLEECVGIVDIRWGTDDQCAQPFEVNSGHFFAPYSSSYFSNTSRHYALVLGGTNELVPLYTTLGSDPTLDTITFATDIDVHPACDEIQEVCINVTPHLSGGGSLGALTGPYDILGETEQASTFIQAHNGPDYNYRYGYFDPPEMPLGAPDTWWTLPNMVPGDYYVHGDSIVRTGRQKNRVKTPFMRPEAPTGSATVVAGSTSDLQKTFDGSSRYPFIMTPAFIQGSIKLADPSAENGGSYSSLSALVFSTDLPGSTAAPAYTQVYAYDTQTWHGLSVTSFPGTFDTMTGMFVSSYEQVIANTYDLPTPWRQEYLRLYMQDSANNRNGSLYLQRDPTDHVLGPNDVIAIDHHYCFNEVKLSYSTANGLLFNPRANVAGTFSGTDWEGNVTSYKASGDFWGSPVASGDAAAAGDVQILVPQGIFTITPGASILSESGGTSTASFKTVTLTVGCGQHVEPTLGLSVSLDQFPPCAPAAQIDITGQIDSSGDPVDRIWYTINGGMEIDICSSGCGANPGIATTASLMGCGNSIQVFASVGANVASVTAQTVWDDPSDGVACAGESCNPPEAACAEVKVEAIACESGDLGWTGTYELTLAIHNNAGTPIVHVLLPDSHLSPHVVTLASPLLPGESTTVTVTVGDVNSDSTSCFDVGLTDAEDNACCSQHVCIPLPTCCFTAEALELACVPGAPGGTFTASFGMVNHTSDVIEHVFVHAPDGVSVTPDYIDVPSVIPGDVALVGPMTFSGAALGKFCVTVGIHDESMDECCSEEICFDVPGPCEEETRDGDYGCSVHFGSSSSFGSLGGAALLGIVALTARRRRRRARSS